MMNSAYNKEAAGVSPASKKGPVTVGVYELGNEEVELRLYEGPMAGTWSAIVCKNWHVLSLTSGFSSTDVTARALALARERLKP